MGMLPVRIDDHREVHVKDNVSSPAGWHLWMSLWVDGVYVHGDEGAIVQDLEEATLADAARGWVAGLPEDKPF